MKRLLFAFSTLAFVLSAKAQSRAQVTATATAHSVVLTWGASADAGNASLTYNVYRFVGACPSGVPTGFTKLATDITGLTYTDGSIVPGSYCYYATAQLNGLESAPSNLVEAGVLPLPPGSLAVTSAQ